MIIFAYALALVACVIVTLPTGLLSGFILAIANMMVTVVIALLGSVLRISSDSTQAMFMVSALITGFFWGVLIRIAQTFTILFVLIKFGVVVSPYLAILFVVTTVISWSQISKGHVGLGINFGSVAGTYLMFLTFQMVQP